MEITVLGKNGTIKYKNSDIIINSFTTDDTATDVIPIDYNQQIFAVRCDPSMDVNYVLFCKIEDSGQFIILCAGIYFDNVLYMPKYGIRIIFRDYTINIYDNFHASTPALTFVTDNSQLLNETQCKIPLSRFNTVNVYDEWIFVYDDIFDGTVLINLTTKLIYKLQIYICDLKSDGLVTYCPLNSSKFYYLNFKRIIEYRLTTKEDVEPYKIEIYQKSEPKCVIPFSKDYVERIRNELLSTTLLSILVDLIVILYLGI